MSWYMCGVKVRGKERCSSGDGEEQIHDGEGKSSSHPQTKQSDVGVLECIEYV